MKRLASLILAICLTVGIAIPTQAINDQENDILVAEGNKEISIVASLDELRAAIETAVDGDTIAISQKIKVFNETLSCDKDITVIRADDFTDDNMFLVNGSIIEGLKFRETLETTGICVVYASTETTVFENCIFDGGSVSVGVGVYGLQSVASVKLRNCEFLNCYINSIWGNQYTDITMENCYVHDSYAVDARGAVHSSGNLTLIGSTVSNNTAVAGSGVNCSGTLKISDCRIFDNIATNINEKVAVDVFSTGTWSITDDPHDGAGYYDVTTGTKADLPVTDNSAIAKLIYLRDDEAKIYFAIPEVEENPDPTDPPKPEDNGEGDLPADDPPPPAQPETPADPQEPEDGENNQDNNQAVPETPETPVEPQEPGDNEDAPVDNQEPTEAPETPPEDEPEDEDTYTPPVIDRPTYRPPVIIQRPKEPTEKPAPALTCGDAVIDTSRSVVLQGYGDGSLHENDPLTRAQLATIIFRLLTDETIEKYGDGSTVFEDVPADAWHYQYVSTIAKAGIVVGTGDGHYNPNGLVTWAQAITILSRFVEPHEYTLVQIQYSGWALQAIQTAASLGWIEDAATFDPDSVISRGELVSLVNGVLENYR